MHKRIISLLMIIIFIAFITSGCFDAREIDDEVYAITIGVDAGKTNMVRLTVQYPTYKGGGGAGAGGGGGGGGGSAKEPMGVQSKFAQSGTNVHTIEAPTMLEAVDTLSVAVSRHISFLHAKLLIFSEEYAKRGIEGYIAGLERYRETRSSMSVMVVKGTAQDYILENQANIGESLYKSEELLLAQSNYTGFFPKVSFREFYASIFSPRRNPIALYGGINNFEAINRTSDKPPRIISRKGLVPGDIPRIGVSKRELAGLAVFNGGEMVGYLDAYETAAYLMIIGQYNDGKISISDKNSPGNAIVFDVHKSRKPKVKAYFMDGKPVIDLNIKLEGEVFVIQSRIDYEKLSLAKQLESQIEDYLLESIRHTIDKTQKELKSDIIGFGEWVQGNFFTIEDWEAYNWLSHYSEATINTTLDYKVRRTGLINHSSPIYSNEGKGE